MKTILLVLSLVLAAACGPGEPRIPARPPESLPQVDLNPAPRKTSLLDEVKCGTTVDEVNVVLKRLALTPLREVEPNVYLSTTVSIEARMTFRDGKLNEVDLTDGAGRSSIVCDTSNMSR